MDPISTLGAVASIVQLSSAAISLSKALYTVGSAISSAPEDIQSLAEDLEDFAGSLNIFSRLLGDSESFYSDDIYLCAAKIMRDASNLYVKIQRLVGKLGKGGWKARVRWGFREGEVRKLMARLRDMKGSLVHVTVSLHLDLELSRLGISSGSKLQRGKGRFLRPETIQRLEEASRVVKANNILVRNSLVPEFRDKSLEQPVFLSSDSKSRSYENQEEMEMDWKMTSLKIGSNQDDLTVEKSISTAKGLLPVRTTTRDMAISSGPTKVAPTARGSMATRNKSRKYTNEISLSQNFITPDARTETSELQVALNSPTGLSEQDKLNGLDNQIHSAANSLVGESSRSLPRRKGFPSVEEATTQYSAVDNSILNINEIMAGDTATDRSGNPTALSIAMGIPPPPPPPLKNTAALSTAMRIPPTSLSQNPTSLSTAMGIPPPPLHPMIRLMAFPQSTIEPANFASKRISPSLKSLPSIDSFKSAVSVQNEDFELKSKIEEVVGNILHAFRTAIDVFKHTVDEKAPRSWQFETATNSLKVRLGDGWAIINGQYNQYLKFDESRYVCDFKEVDVEELEKIPPMLMTGIVVELHMHSTKPDSFRETMFKRLCSVSEGCRVKACFELEKIQRKLLYPDLEWKRAKERFPPLPMRPEHSLFCSPPREQEELGMFPTLEELFPNGLPKEGNLRTVLMSRSTTKRSSEAIKPKDEIIVSGSHNQSDDLQLDTAAKVTGKPPNGFRRRISQKSDYGKTNYGKPNPNASGSTGVEPHSHYYVPDYIGCNNSPQMNAVNVNFQPSSTPPYMVPLPPAVSPISSSGSPGRKGSRPFRTTASQSDAGLVSMMGNGKNINIARQAGAEVLVAESDTENESGELTKKGDESKKDTVGGLINLISTKKPKRRESTTSSTSFVSSDALPAHDFTFKDRPAYLSIGSDMLSSKRPTTKRKNTRPKYIPQTLEKQESKDSDNTRSLLPTADQIPENGFPDSKSSTWKSPSLTPAGEEVFRKLMGVDEYPLSPLDHEGAIESGQYPPKPEPQLNDQIYGGGGEPVGGSWYPWGREEKPEDDHVKEVHDKESNYKSQEPISKPQVTNTQIEVAKTEDDEEAPRLTQRRSRNGAQKRVTGKSRNETDDWSGITDPKERKRIQNRIAQRKFRDKTKEAKEREERDAENRVHAGNSYFTTDPHEMDGVDTPSGLPWESISLKYVVTKTIESKREEARRLMGSNEYQSAYEVGPFTYSDVRSEENYYDNSYYYESDPKGPPGAYYDSQNFSYFSIIEQLSKEEQQAAPNRTETPGLWSKTRIRFQNDLPGVCKSLESHVGERTRIIFPRRVSHYSGQSLLTLSCEASFNSQKPLQTSSILGEILDVEEKIITTIFTVDKQIGLEMSSFAWNCIWLLLLELHKIILLPPPPTFLESHLKTLFEQLQDVVGVVARYAVMENLYVQNPTLTVRQDYEDEMITMCTVILRYFEKSFTTLQKFTAKADVLKLSQLIEEVKRKDEVCQKFTVTIDEMDIGGSESENVIEQFDSSDEDTTSIGEKSKVIV